MRTFPQPSLTAGLIVLIALMASFSLAWPGAENYTQPAVLPPIPSASQATTVAIPTLHMGVLGDTGSGASFQKAVAQELLTYHQQHPMQGVLHLGDIIYPSGEIERFGEKLYINYYQPLWTSGAPFYPVLGNHDVRHGFRQAMLDFYRMPGRYYHFQKTAIAGNSQVSVDFYAIDTNIANDKTQIEWLKAELAQSTANWQIVYGHEPAYSSGIHGNSSTLQKLYEPLFEQYGVDAYLAGHDHDYERFAPKHGVLHVVSGGGGAYLRHFPRVAAGSQVRLNTHHFMALSFTPNQLTGVVIDKTGTVIDRFEHHPSQPLQ